MGLRHLAKALPVNKGHLMAAEPKSRRVVLGCFALVAMLLGIPPLFVGAMHRFSPYRLSLLDLGPIMAQTESDLASQSPELTADIEFGPGERLYVRIEFPPSSPLLERARLLRPGPGRPSHEYDIPIVISVARLTEPSNEEVYEIVLSNTVPSSDPAKGYILSVGSGARYELYVNNDNIVRDQSRVRVMVSYSGPEKGPLPCIVTVRRLPSRTKAWKIVDSRLRRQLTYWDSGVRWDAETIHIPDPAPNTGG